MIDDEEIRALVDDLNAGKPLAAVSVIDLKRAWGSFSPYQEQVARETNPTTIEEMIGPFANVPALFVRCILLAGLVQRGVTLTDSLFEELALQVLDKDSMAAFMQQRGIGKQ